jgi:hypothetical protein
VLPCGTTNVTESRKKSPPFVTVSGVPVAMTLTRSASSAMTTTVATPSRPPYSPEMVAGPADRPVTIPWASTVTTSGRADDHVASKATSAWRPRRLCCRRLPPPR